MLQSLKLRTRLALIIGVTLVGFVLLAVITLSSQRAALYESHEQRLINLVEVAAGLVEHFHALEVSGAMSRSEAQKAAAEALSALRFSGADYFYVFTGGAIGVVHPGNPKFVGLDLSKSSDPVAKGLAAAIKAVAESKDAAPRKPSAIQTKLAGSNQPVTRLVLSNYFAPWDWVLGSGVMLTSVNTVINHAIWEYVVLIGVVLTVAVGLSLLVARSVTRQLGGEPAEAVAIMRKVAAGDLAVSVGTDESGDSLLAALASMLQNLRGMMAAVGRSATEVAQEAKSIAQTSRAVADSSHGSSESTATMAAAVEEMTISIRHISDTARETEKDSAEAAALAENGAQEVAAAASEIRRVADTIDSASQSVSSLLVRANEVNSIAAVIKEIAAQTNLLALNAAIESARAGEQGRGFAVVAGEVRSLAARTAEATMQIEEMLAGIQSEVTGTVKVMEQATPQVQSGVDRIGGAVDLLTTIREGASATRVRVSEVAHSTSEQTIASNNISEQVGRIAGMVEQTSASMKSAARSVEALDRQAAELQGLVRRFRY